jgi:molecular chaperone DnaJ
LELPKSLTKRQEELLRELAEEEHRNVSPHRKSFFEKLRNYFIPEEPTPGE